ncbi:hypothetical protein LCGC14_1487090 [marine sediment metagenome]|uniref:Uncharacterized protein n=1 Tax=marine sediment metagenome TaxID=412755 RepID=A0A0F9M9S1_9ZZZZ
MKVLVECRDCKKNIIKDIEYQEWLSLFNYFECEYLNGKISKELCDTMINRLCTFKPEFKD